MQTRPGVSWDRSRLRRLSTSVTFKLPRGIQNQSIKKTVRTSRNGLFIRGRTDFMSVSKRVTVNAKITEEESARLNLLAERENISITALIRLLVNGVLDGEIVVEKGEIKSCPTTDEMGVSEDDFMENLRYKELKLDKLASVFDEYGYPDYLVRQQIEMMISQIKENGKYNPRKSNSDYGC